MQADDGSYAQDNGAQIADTNGMLPQAGDPQGQQYDSSYGAVTTAPPMDDPSAPPADYIMTGGPAETQSLQEEPVQQEAQDSPGEPVPVASYRREFADANLHGQTPDELMQIKQQALQQLSPLIGHLEQSPEERFRTAMMMLQATDDQTLIKTAYAAAQEITDEKAKAQALFDIVNEINYFSQKNGQPH